MKHFNIAAGGEYRTRALLDYRGPGMEPVILAVVFGTTDEDAEDLACVMGGAYDMLAFVQAIVKGEYEVKDDCFQKARELLREIGVE